MCSTYCCTWSCVNNIILKEVSPESTKQCDETHASINRQYIKRSISDTSAGHTHDTTSSLISQASILVATSGSNRGAECVWGWPLKVKNKMSMWFRPPQFRCIQIKSDFVCVCSCVKDVWPPSLGGRRHTLRHMAVNAHRYFCRLSSVFLCSRAMALNLVQSKRPRFGSNTTPKVETTR